MRYNELRRIVYRFSFICAVSIFVLLIYYYDRSEQHTDEAIPPRHHKPPSVVPSADPSIDKIGAGMQRVFLVYQSSQNMYLYVN